MKRVTACGLAAAALTCVSMAAGAKAQGSAPQPAASLARDVLVSELIGMRVSAPNGERVGAVEDLVLSSGNAVAAAIVSVGGFLGLGAKRVEVPYEKLAVGRDASLVVAMTREEVEALPAYSSAAYAVPTPPPPSATSPPPQPAPRPSPEARAEAQAEAARSFATDDPRVSQGIAENKEAFDDDGADREDRP
jgi:sporulation protein YlmC with PRC-barrel domain